MNSEARAVAQLSACLGSGFEGLSEDQVAAFLEVWDSLQVRAQSVGRGVLAPAAGTSSGGPFDCCQKIYHLTYSWCRAISQAATLPSATTGALVRQVPSGELQAVKQATLELAQRSEGALGGRPPLGRTMARCAARRRRHSLVRAARGARLWTDSICKQEGRGPGCAAADAPRRGQAAAAVLWQRMSPLLTYPFA
jgi:hypothetical protein